MDAEDDAKPRKRVVTPARREQNRVAQKLYRQRRKSRQQALRERNQEKPTRPLVLRPQPSPRTTSDGAFSSGNAEFRVVGQEEVLLDGSQRETAAVLDHSPSCDPEYVRWVDVQSAQLTSPTVDSPAQPDIITDEATQALLPDPYQNSIQLAKTITYSAFLSNALSLNFSIRELVYSNCRGTQSPFYRASTPQSDAREVVAAVSSPSMPSHLQPTLQQVLIPHHPFIDLLPFPALRSRVIALSASMPHVFDIMELKVDIYVRGGLVCWVGGTSGQPWDMRSWEAAPWFLRKWRLLVDGEDGELWKSSVWWQGMRNEGSASTSL
ncbi:hypothetical protein NKR23_g10464 [Pleurostoma richardsiae]|uniref:BZIP domain-containing protein n=1 Tax=Pleurostoma richardsiae TaxID=41990 RepID=A0AA38RA17_9PEZI|nr:hypothetical protein NKR23_g10464 [Pleurostoma richardsiae]